MKHELQHITNQFQMQLSSGPSEFLSLCFSVFVLRSKRIDRFRETATLRRPVVWTFPKFGNRMARKLGGYDSCPDGVVYGSLLVGAVWRWAFAPGASRPPRTTERRHTKNIQEYCRAQSPDLSGAIRIARFISMPPTIKEIPSTGVAKPSVPRDWCGPAGPENR